MSIRTNVYTVMEAKYALKKSWRRSKLNVYLIQVSLSSRIRPLPLSLPTCLTYSLTNGLVLQPDSLPSAFNNTKAKKGCKLQQKRIVTDRWYILPPISLSAFIQNLSSWSRETHFSFNHIMTKQSSSLQSWTWRFRSFPCKRTGEKKKRERESGGEKKQPAANVCICWKIHVLWPTAFNLFKHSVMHVERLWDLMLDWKDGASPVSSLHTTWRQSHILL